MRDRTKTRYNLGYNCIIKDFQNKSINSFQILVIKKKKLLRHLITFMSH